jgi:hypothetical protein
LTLHDAAPATRIAATAANKYTKGPIVTSSQKKAQQLARSRTAFCTFLAILMVVCRVLFYDHTLFEYQSLPNHDMSQGLAFFTTSVQSMRLTGDIAWWNPASNTGYAQYYQSFFSPLAPTTGNIVFIIWVNLSRFLNISEYNQYLIVNYLILAFLTFFSVALFLSYIFRRRAPIVMILIVYTFSGIGLWNSAWFYFQEPFTFFLLMAAILALFQRPTQRRLLFVIAAALIQFTSLNYWTVYNLWFFVFLVGAYIVIYRTQAYRLWKRAPALLRQPQILALGAGAAIVVVLWGILFGSIIAEQSDAYIRTKANRTSLSAYTEQDAFERIQSVRSYTLNLVDPNINRAILFYRTVNLVHNARYIGVFLVPLLALGLAYPWRRREWWLFSVLGLILCVCIGSAMFVKLWDTIPFMNRILHQLYFYSQYWQFTLALFAGSVLDRLINRSYTERQQRRFSIVLFGAIGVGVFILLEFYLLAPLFPNNNAPLQSVLMFALFLMFSSILIWQLVVTRRQLLRNLAVAGLLLFAFSDLSRYFWQVSRLDRDFTVSRWTVHDLPLKPDLAAALNTRWPAPDLGAGFNANLALNMPFTNNFWPENIFMAPVSEVDVRSANPRLATFVSSYPDVAFFKTTQQSNLAQVSKAFKQDETHFKRILILNVGKTGPPAAAPSQSEDAEFSYKFLAWGYNDYDIQVNAPDRGWIMLRQLYDPLWQVSVDGQPVAAVRADFVATAVQLAAGDHIIHAEYWPLARRLYPFASLALIIELLAIAVTAWRLPAYRGHSQR